MNLPVQRYSARWMQFERFERETAQGTATKTASYRHWLSPSLVRDLQTAPTARETRRIDFKFENGWPGVYHVGHEFILRALRVGVPAHLAVNPVAEDGKESYRARYYTHEFLWEHQAVSGRRWEFILERRRPDRPVFDQLAALMGDPSAPQDGQMFVVRDGRGDWVEADAAATRATPRGARQDFYLETMGLLALQGRPAEEILPTDSQKS